MSNTKTIALNVIKDAVRRKLFYIVFLFGLAVVALSPLLPSFELGLRVQFLRDISLSLASLFGVVLAAVLSVGQIPGEVSNRTIYNFLSKPLSRVEYFLGKYLGMLATLILVLFIMWLEVLALIYARLHVFTPIITQGFFAIFLECALISSFCIFLSTFSTVPINVFATILFYVITHIKTGYLHEKLVEGIHGIGRIFSWALYYLIPNLENFNLSQKIGYGKGVSAFFLLRITGYALLFILAFLILGYAVFRRKDL